MSSNRGRSKRQSSMIAFCGLMCALTIALMLLGGFIPVATYCVPMAGGILLLPILLEYGKKAAWTAYGAVSLITLMLGVDKEAAFFYLFLGYYPIIKWNIDKIKKRPLRLLLKLLVFNVAIVTMYAMLSFVLGMYALVEEFTQMGPWLLILFAALLNFCMLLYDFLLVPMVFLYVKKIKPRLRFIH